MNKILSFIVSLVLVISFFTSKVEAYTWHEADISDFISAVNEMYDKKYSISETSNDSAVSRVIIKSSKKPSIYNNAEFVEGTNNIYIMQYSNIDLAQEALQYFKSLSYVEWAELDYLMCANESITTYGNAMMQSNEAKKYILEHNITSEKVTVAVLDSGARFTAGLLENRVVDSGVNTSDSGDKKSAYDDNGHGTQVAGIIVNNTNENVEIVAYKVLNSNKQSTNLSVALGIQAAINDNVDVINLSLSGMKYSELLYEAICEAYQRDIVVVCSAGNDNKNTENYYPAAFEETITVGSIDEKGNRSFFSNWGENVDFVAPGHNISVTTNKIDYGTSFSAPFVTAAAAMVLTVSGEMGCEQVKNCLIESCITYDNLPYYDGFNEISDYDVNAPSDNQPYLTLFEIGTEKEELYYGYGMPQVSTAVAIATDGFVNIDAPQFSLSSGTYNEAVKVELLVPTGYDVYYTTDDTYPSSKNGKQYTTPISVESSLSIRAIAYNKKGIRSVPVAHEYKIECYANEDDFEINSNGYITAYNGSLRELIVPDIIDSTSVRGVDSYAFYNDSRIRSISFPETVTEVQEFAFYGSKVEFVSGLGVECVGEESFYGTPLLKLDMPNLKQIGESALSNTKLRHISFPELIDIGYNAISNNLFLSTVSLPKLKYVAVGTFEECKQLRTVHLNSAYIIDSIAFRYCFWLKEVYAPNLEKLTDTAKYNMDSMTTFHQCVNLTKVDFPKVISVDGKCFSDCWSLNFVNLPNAKYIGEGTFERCKVLKTVNLPKAEIVGEKTFLDTFSLYSLALPSVKVIKSNCFENSAIVTLTAPVLEELGSYIFSYKNSMSEKYYQNTSFKNFVAPNLKNVGDYGFAYTAFLEKLDLPNLESMGNNVFFESSIRFFNAPNLTQSGSFPMANGSSIVLSSKFVNYCYDSINSSLTVFGTPETYAEIFANEHNLSFVAVPIIITQPQDEFNSVKDIIFVDVIGFNVEYQWYGATDKIKFHGDKLIGAEYAEFCPNDYKAYPYYFCVITSTDCGTITELTTEMVENKFTLADYSVLNKVLERVPDDLSAYTPESRNNLEQAIGLVEEGLTISYQAEVDAITESIERALLNLIPATIVLSDSYLKLNKNEYYTINVEGNIKVHWSSDNTEIAFVDENGVVTAVRNGIATITATAETGITAICVVEVNLTLCQWVQYLLDILYHIFLSLFIQ